MPQELSRMDPARARLTGRYEDLMTLLVRLEERILAREGLRLPQKSRASRLLIEPPLNLLAYAFGAFLRLLPPTVAYRFFLWTFDKLTGYKYQSDGITIAEESVNAVNTYRNLEQSGEPALIAIASHPPVLGEIRDLNLGLMGAAFRLMQRVRAEQKPFRVFLAVDVMALDTLAVAEEAVYAGAMGAYHVAIDRLPSQRHTLQPFLFGGISYGRAAWRIAAALRRKENLVIVHPGGVRETARILYTTREFVWSLRKKTKQAPGKVLAAFRASEPGFSAFLSHYSEWGSAWRKLEAYLSALFSRDPLATGQDVSRQTIAPCESGELAGSDRKVLLALTAAFGLAAEAGEEAVAAFAEEFARITPYRIRFFNFLLWVCRRNKVPVLLLPLDHSITGPSPIIARAPLGLLPRGGRVLRVDPDPASAAAPVVPAEFRAWGLATFHV